VNMATMGGAGCDDVLTSEMCCCDDVLTSEMCCCDDVLASEMCCCDDVLASEMCCCDDVLASEMCCCGDVLVSEVCRFILAVDRNERLGTLTCNEAETSARHSVDNTVCVRVK
jgi:hypothetical protein